MPLRVNELDAGINYWRNETSWPPDYHNAFYRRMRDDINLNYTFDQVWWQKFRRELHRWRATRPKSYAYLTERFEANREALQSAWNLHISANLKKDIENMNWQDICEFPAIVSQIKGVVPPVFTSKFCHFLAPSIFPVIDNEAMGMPFDSYEEYYNFARDEWRQTNARTQVQLVDHIIIAIGREQLFEGYPLKCKVIELCLIGR